MNKKTIAIIVGVLVLAVAGYCLYDWVLGETAPPSGPMTTVPLGTPAATPVTTPAVTPVATQAATPAITPEATPAATPTANPAGAPAGTPLVITPILETPAATPAATPEAVAATPAPTPAGPRMFAIDPSASKAQFTIFEVLRGKDKDVIGETNQVSGELELNPEDLAASRIGTITINARALQTDDQYRNRAIGNRILHTDAHEFISFTPTAITGLSGKASAGDSMNFKIAGDLNIQGVTKPVVFDAVFKLENADKIIGYAESMVQRGDYGIIVPNLPFIANVGTDVKLRIEATLLPKP